MLVTLLLSQLPILVLLLLSLSLSLSILSPQLRGCQQRAAYRASCGLRTLSTTTLFYVTLCPTRTSCLHVHKTRTAQLLPSPHSLIKLRGARDAWRWDLPTLFPSSPFLTSSVPPPIAPSN